MIKTSSGMLVTFLLIIASSLLAEKRENQQQQPVPVPIQIENQKTPPTTSTSAQNQEPPVAISTLAQAVKTALRTHPSLSAAGKARQAFQMGIDEARGELFPSVDLRAAIGREESENRTVIASGDQHRTLTRFESSLLVRQSVYTGGRISSNIDKRRSLASQQFYRYLDEKERVAFNAIDSYVEFCLNRALITLARSNVEEHKKILQAVEERARRGVARESEVVEVKGRLALAEAQYKREFARKVATTEQFREAVGAPPEGQLVEPSGDNQALPAKLQDAQNQAMAQHPSIMARQHNVAAAYAAIEESASLFYPQVSLELRLAENDNVGGSRGNDDAYSAMLVVNWNVFKGGSDKAAKETRIFEAAEGEDLLFDEKRKIARNIGVAWSQYVQTLSELDYLLQSEKSSAQTVDAYREQYKLNQRTLFDLLNAQERFFVSSSRVIETKYAKVRDLYSIFANMGNVSFLFDADPEKK